MVSSFFNNNHREYKMSKPSRRIKREKQKEIRRLVKKNQKLLRDEKNKNGESIQYRTKANNAKFRSSTVTEELVYRQDLVAEQIKAWQALLPKLLKRFKRIKDPRNTNNIKYSITTLMLYGLLAAIFRFVSRRDANEKMSRPQFIAAIKNIFPDLDLIPHADTLGRLLERINPSELESICVSLLSDLIKKKRFKKFLINGCIPISIDGTQKLVRNGFFNEHCHDRTINTTDGTKMQQYVFVVEANVTLFNGLTIPIASEFLHYDLDLPEDAKNDCELNACKRLMGKIKKYFPRAKFIVFLDGLYPGAPIIEQIKSFNWDGIIYLQQSKKKAINELLDQAPKQIIPGQKVYRERNQEFSFIEDVPFDNSGKLLVNAVSCVETWEEVCLETGKIITKHSVHRWISTVKVNIKNVHEICNLGARKRCLIEDSMNTEKNRGYYYEHALSTNWNALLCYHLLMRLGHAINAITEFTRKLKKYIKQEGVKVILDLILETIANPWLNSEWIQNEMLKSARLLF